MNQDEQIYKKFNSLMQSLVGLQALTELPFDVQDEATLIRDALMSLMQPQDGQSCSVFVLEEQELVNLAGLDSGELNQDPIGPIREVDTSRFKLGEGIVGIAAEQQSLQRCDDCSNSASFVMKEATKVPGALLSAPIIHGGVVLGVVNISHPQTHFFEAWHERLLSVFASLLGVLLHTHRMLSKFEVNMKRHAEELDIALEHGRDIKSHSEQLALIDELTGLNNRRFFFPQAESALARAIRYQQDYSILLIDIDHFRSLNTNFGHVLGDMVLQDIAEVLQEMGRDSDILARYASGEFVIAAPDTSQQGAEQFAERIAKQVRHLKWSHDGERIASTISVGIAALDTQAPDKSKIDVDRMLMRAEAVLTMAREEGRDRIKVYVGDSKVA